MGHTFARLDQPTVLFHWLAALAFLFQIYYDLSGYSDMALGLARIFGFRLPRNFNYPLLARSIVQFWRRWFISLGAWFRDYVYEPLTGKAAGPGRRAISLLAIGAMLGLWHGGGWNLMVWGLVLPASSSWSDWSWASFWTASQVVGNLYVLLVLLLNFVLFRGPGLQEG